MRRRHVSWLALVVLVAAFEGRGRADNLDLHGIYNGACNVIAGAAFAPAQIFCKIDSAIYDWMATPRSPEANDIIALKNLMGRVEADIRSIETTVSDLTYEERRQEAISLTRDVDAARASVSAALVLASDNPGSEAAEAQALEAAFSLASPSFMTFPAQRAGFLDRFDPRAALPSFLLAVDSWITIRSAAGRPFGPAAQQAVAQFSGRLLDVSDDIRAAVNCSEEWHEAQRAIVPRAGHPSPFPRVLAPGEKPLKPDWEPGTKTVCVHTISCWDFEPFAAGKVETDGKCHTDGTLAATNKEHRLADYQLDRLAQTAANWRAMAGLSAKPLRRRPVVKKVVHG